MRVGDTIVAVGSAPGRSARAMIRVSGSGTREVLAQALAAPPRAWERGVFASRLRMGLPVLVCQFRTPHSYTGEDSAEILLPGNPALVERVLAMLGAIEGVRHAGPGEFTARAYVNERMTLEQAEGVAAVIAAESAEQLAAADDLLSGRAGDAYRAWADGTATLLALVEAGIDFTDQEDVVAIAPADLRNRAMGIAGAIEDRLGGVAEAATALPRVVLVGKPNAGKSTLFNALLGRERAVVSPEAGTTRDVLEESLDLTAALPGAGNVLLVDMAGLESAAAPAQDVARESVARADVLLHCDPSARFEQAGLPAGTPVIRIRTKADLPAPPPTGVDVSVCALDGWNLGVLRRAIADASGGSRGAGLALILPRHRRALAEAATRLHEAAAHADGASELVASHLRQALDALGELVGRIGPDDVIGRVFATFCVGK